MAVATGGASPALSRAIREELEISAEMQKSANALGESGAAPRGARKKESPKNR